MSKKVIVIGSGISGLSVSRMLSDRFDVEILEKQPIVGGLIKCERVDGNLFHRVGGHVFNSRNPEVLDWFWSHFDRDNEFLNAKRNAKIWLGGSLIGYPLENYLYQLSDNLTRPIIIELLDKLKSAKSEPLEYCNFREFLIGNFGEELFNLYFGPYNTKIWNTDLSKVPLSWLDGKLPMPNIQEVILSNILKHEESGMVHATFYYPKNDGSQFIVNRLSDGLSATCSYNVDTISLSTSEEGGLSINSEEKHADYIVYCGDVRKLRSIIDIENNELDGALVKVENLLSNGTSNVLCETDDTDISWLYLPEDKFRAHRIIYTGNFSRTNNGSETRKTCVVEFSGKVDKNEMIKELDHLPGNLTPLAFNYEPNSYVIQGETTRQDISNLKELLAPYNIFLLGRFAEWEYYNMDKCIEGAMELNKTL